MARATPQGPRAFLPFPVVVRSWDSHEQEDQCVSLRVRQRGVLEGDDIPLRDTPSTVSIEDARRFLGDRARYATETVFWGRRLGRSVYQKVSETPQRQAS